MQQKIRYHIDGMTCQACASRIEKVLNKKPFITAASVNFASEEAQITYDDSQTDPAALIALINKTGYSASLPQDTPPDDAPAQPGWRLWLLLAINLPFLVGMVGMMLGRHDWMLPPAAQLVLASIVQLWLAIPFYKSAWASIKGGLANMDVLVALGTGAIYLYSLAMMTVPHRHGDIYFEAGVMVIGFVSLGKYLEHRSKKTSLNSLGLLLKLTPRQVSVQRNGSWQTLPLDQVQIGDLLRANHGERIAADGIVEGGSGWTDESHLTGESRPEAKEPGSRVLAGALVNDGSLTYRAEQLGKETLLGDMMAALSEAQGSKAPIARIADRAAAIFVPTVVAIAVATFALTWAVKGEWTVALMHAVAVLVIACPCALGLATPAAIMVGMGKAVRHGIWYKDAAAMEEAARVDTVVLGMALLLAPFVGGDHASLTSAGLHDASSAIILLIYMGIRGRLRDTVAAIRTRSGKAVMLAALLGGPVGMSGYLIAINNIGPGYTAIISSFYPAFGTLLAFILLKERMRPGQIIALLVALAAVAVIGWSSSSETTTGSPIVGLLGSLACVVGWGSEAVLLAWGMRDDIVDNETALHIRQTTSGLTYLIIVIPVSGALHFAAGATISTATAIIALAALTGAASYLFYYKAIDTIGASRGMALNISYAAWAVIFALVLQGTVPTSLQVVCCIVALTGTVLAASPDWRELRLARPSAGRTADGFSKKAAEGQDDGTDRDAALPTAGPRS